MIKTLLSNKLGRDFVVGDLHGCLPLLNKALEDNFFEPLKDRLFSVGDLIDRGPDSLGCLRLLNKPWFHAVKGNHEQLMEDWMTGGPTGPWWEHNGGGWFKKLTEDEKKWVVSLLPTIQSLPWLITVEGDLGRTKFHLIHAEMPQEVSDVTDEMLADPVMFKRMALTNAGDGEACIWGRDLFMQFYGEQVTNVAGARRGINMHKQDLTNNDKVSKIFCGHSVMQHPLTISKVTNLDTGAFHVGKGKKWPGLTLACVTTGTFTKTNNEGTMEVFPIAI